MKKTIKHDPCTTDGEPHKWWQGYSYDHPRDGTTRIYECRVCGETKSVGEKGRDDFEYDAHFDRMLDAQTQARFGE